jgi:hypothetical protein
MSAREFEVLPQEAGAPVPVAMPAAVPIDGIRVGQLVGFQDATVPLVIFPGQPGLAAIPARAVLDLTAQCIGRDVVLQFEGQDPLRPIVMGVLHQPTALSAEDAPGHVEVQADGARLTVSAKEEVVLRCGKASITLTKTGKVLIRGTYVLSRSSGVNRIKGGAVQVN